MTSSISVCSFLFLIFLIQYIFGQEFSSPQILPDSTSLPTQLYIFVGFFEIGLGGDASFDILTFSSLSLMFSLISPSTFSPRSQGPWSFVLYLKPPFPQIADAHCLLLSLLPLEE